MLEGLNKLMFAGLGALSMSRERAEKLFDEFVQRGQADKEHRSKFVQDLMDAADQTKKDMEKLVAEQVRKVVETMDLATREDISRLEGKIDKQNKQG